MCKNIIPNDRSRNENMTVDNARRVGTSSRKGGLFRSLTRGTSKSPSDSTREELLVDFPPEAPARRKSGTSLGIVARLLARSHSLPINKVNGGTEGETPPAQDANDIIGQHEQQLAVKSAIASIDEEKVCDDDEEEEHGDEEESKGKEEDARKKFSRTRRFSDSERFDNEAWRMRLTAGSVFSPDYTPQRWERNEMENIIDSLELKRTHDDTPDDDAPKSMAEYLDEPGLEVTKQAIGTIFFNGTQGHGGSNDAPSVLLKRGPILVGGEARELMIFTKGFLLARVDINSLAKLLLNAIEHDEGDEIALGELDRSEMGDLFQGMGMPLSAATLDGLIEEFKSRNVRNMSMSRSLRDIAHQPEDESKSESTISKWGSLADKIKRSLGGRKSVAVRKLDAAYQMSDIDRIEHVGELHAEKADVRGIKEWAEITFALFIKGFDDPLLVTCSKPDHLTAWMEAFRTCITSLKADKSHRTSYGTRPGLIRGTLSAREIPTGKSKKIRSSLEKWKGASIDWVSDKDMGEDSSRPTELIHGAESAWKPTEKDKRNRPSLEKWNGSSLDWGGEDDDI